MISLSENGFDLQAGLLNLGKIRGFYKLQVTSLTYIS